MDKQEGAFTLWANSVLQPDEEHILRDSDLATKRLCARIRGLLWRLYTEDEGVITVMLRIEQRINDGLLRTKSEVRFGFFCLGFDFSNGKKNFDRDCYTRSPGDFH